MTTPEPVNPTSIVHVDGTSSNKSKGVGVILEAPDGMIIEQAIEIPFPATNNQAEYEALLAAVELASTVNVQELTVYNDSQLVIQQMTGEFEAKEETILKYHSKAQRLAAKFQKIEFRHVLRDQNSRADKLAKLANKCSKAGRESIICMTLEQPSINEEEVCQIGEGSTSMTPIIQYLKDGTLPADKAEARNLSRRAAKYFLCGETLYKKGFSSPSLKCVPPYEADYILRELHEGVCGSHQAPATLKRKTLQAGFYWPGIINDVDKLVKTCDKCQRHGNAIHKPSEDMHPLQAPWPFDVWGIDILGPFPQATSQRKFLEVAVDHFTKWIEAEPLAPITSGAMKRFVMKNIITRFGIPRALVRYNGRQFFGQQFQEFCEDYHIKINTTSVEHPATNSQTKLANRIILKGLKTRLDGAKGRWVDELPSVLWSYRVKNQTAT